MTMDDPTTYLYRNPANKAIILAPSLALAQEACREYGCAIQCSINNAVYGIFVATSLEHAQTAVATLPPDTPWAWLPAGSNGRQDDAATVLTGYFGLAKTMAEALNVETRGIAWRPDRYPVQG